MLLIYRRVLATLKILINKCRGNVLRQQVDGEVVTTFKLHRWYLPVCGNGYAISRIGQMGKYQKLMQML
ncbi:MAG: hypothetical protein JEZ07_01590 [Phycisphaerae bacterium]|nr:hypothetical protein [Phycisphaerae bacterium]